MKKLFQRNRGGGRIRPPPRRWRVKPCKYSICIIGTIAVRGLLQTTAKTKRQATTIEHPAVTPAISSFVQIAFCNLDLLFFDLKRNEDKTRLHPSVSMPAPAPKYMMLYTHTLYFPCPFQLSRCTDAWWPRASRAIARRPRAVPHGHIRRPCLHTHLRRRRRRVAWRWRRARIQEQTNSKV